MLATLQKAMMPSRLHDIFRTLRHWYVDRNKQQRPLDSYIWLKRRIEKVVGGERVEEINYDENTRMEAIHLKDTIPILWHELWGIFNGDVEVLRTLHIIDEPETVIALSPDFANEIRKYAALVLARIIREQLTPIIASNATDSLRHVNIEKNIAFLDKIANESVQDKTQSILGSGQLPLSV